MRCKQIVQLFMVVAIAAIFTVNLAAAEKSRVAVLEVAVTETVEKSLKSITSYSLVSIFKENKKIIILTPDEITSRLKFKIEGCNTVACAVKIGQLLNVDYVVISKVAKYSNYTLTNSLVDLKQKKIIATKTNSFNSKYDVTKVAQKNASSISQVLDYSKDTSNSRSAVVNLNGSNAATVNNRNAYGSAAVVSRRGSTPGDYNSNGRIGSAANMNSVYFYDDNNFLWTASLYYIIPGENMNDYYDHGVGVSTTLGIRASNMLYGIQFGFNSVEAKGMDYSYINVSYETYPILFVLSRFLTVGRSFRFAPKLSIGVAYTRLAFDSGSSSDWDDDDYDSDTSYGPGSWDPMAKVGLDMVIGHRAFCFTIGYEHGIILEPNNTQQHMNMIKIGFQLLL